MQFVEGKGWNGCVEFSEAFEGLALTGQHGKSNVSLRPDRRTLLSEVGGILIVSGSSQLLPATQVWFPHLRELFV